MSRSVPRLQRLTSRQHDVVRRCRRLATHREAGPLVLLDGEHLLGEALAARLPVVTVVTDGEASGSVARARSAGAEVYLASPSVIAAASPVKSPAGIVSIARWQPQPLEDTIGAADTLAIGLVNVQDPGNVGGAIRGAAALGATGVACLDGTADPGGWRALRGAMGSTFRLPVARGATAAAIALARGTGVRVVAASARQGAPLDRADLSRPLLVLLGHEGTGLPEAVLSKADAHITIPMARGVESLNVAVTAALILFEAQRRAGGSR